MHKHCAKHFLSLFLQNFKITGLKINPSLQTYAVLITLSNILYAMVVPVKDRFWL